jgi:hypothetical protein
MNYIIIICLSIGILHFVLYYLNIEPFELSSKPKHNDYTNDISNNVISNNRTNMNNTYAKDIEESINELKKLNEYIDNESRPITQC